MRLNATEKRKGDGRNAGLEELAVQLQRINLLKRCCCERAKSQTGAKQKKTEQARMLEKRELGIGCNVGAGNGMARGCCRLGAFERKEAVR